MVWFDLLSWNPYIKFGIAFSDPEISFNVLATMCFVTILHRWCKVTVVPQNFEFLTSYFCLSELPFPVPALGKACGCRVQAASQQNHDPSLL